MKEKVQLGHKPDFKKIQQFFADIAASHFPSIENDFGKADKQEFLEQVTDQFIDECDKTLKEVEKVLKKLMS